MPKRNTAGANTIEKFTGKERDEEGGLNLDYFGARYYDPALGRWHSVDLLAKHYPEWSPYVYTLGNPINVIDPDGRMACEPEEDCPEENTSMITQVQQYLQVSVKNIQLPSFVGTLFGIGKEKSERVVEGLDKGIEATSTVSEVSDAAGLGLTVAAIPTEGATLPAAGVFEGISLGADITGAALMTAKTKLTGGNASKTLLRQSVRIGVGIGVNKSLEKSAGLFVKRTNFQTGPQFRGAQSGEFVTNLRGFSTIAAAVGLPAAISLYVNAFLED